MENLNYSDIDDTDNMNSDFTLYADYSDYTPEYEYQPYEPIYADNVYPDNLIETVRKVRVVRQGQRVIKKQTDKPGYKMVGGKEVRMSPKEKRNRLISQRKAARKRKPKQKAAERKRKRSLRKR